MSTAGKVLTALTMLMTLVWVLLTATVTQLNRNGTKAVDDLKVQVERLEGQLTQMTRDIQTFKDQAALQQHETNNQITSLQVRQADAEKALAIQRENASRVKFQLEGEQASVKAAENLSAERLAEKDAEAKAKAKAQEQVETLKAENAKLFEHLTSLRAKFKAKLEENRKMVQRLQKSSTPTNRRASYTQAR